MLDTILKSMFNKLNRKGYVCFDSCTDFKLIRNNQFKVLQGQQWMEHEVANPCLAWFSLAFK